MVYVFGGAIFTVSATHISLTILFGAKNKDLFFFSLEKTRCLLNIESVKEIILICFSLVGRN